MFTVLDARNTEVTETQSISLEQSEVGTDV